MKISDKIMKIIFLVSMIFLISMTIYWLTGNLIFPIDLEEFAAITQFVIIVTAIGIGTVILILIGIMYKLSTMSGKIWFLLGLGILGWFIGEFLYNYLEIFLKIEPFPSIADFFYLIAYLPLSIGLILQMRLIKIKLSTLEIIIVLILFAIICVLVSLFVIIFPIQDWYSWDIPAEEVIPLLIGMAYPVVDLILLFFAMFVLTKLRHGKISIAWLLLLIGIICTIIADIIYNYIENTTGSQLFELYDLVFLIGYVFIYLSGFSIINVMSKSFEQK